jgi:hypothetical protein
MACAHPDDPGVLEATIRLGELEGTWAELYDRRERLYAGHTALVQSAWRDLVVSAGVDVHGAVRGFRRLLDLTTESTEGDEKERREAAAKAAAMALLAALLLDKHDARYKVVVEALSEALRVAEAEGVAGALAIAAQQARDAGVLVVDGVQVDVVSTSFDLVFHDAYDALANLGTYWSQAEGWLANIVAGASTDLGHLLVGLAEGGAGFDDMAAAVSEFLGADSRAASYVVDLAMGQSFSRGAISLYRREGVRTVDYVTAGDARVCGRCHDVESENPHPIGDVLAPPLHGFCRCVLVPTNPIESLNVGHYITGGTE